MLSNTERIIQKQGIVLTKTNFKNELRKSSVQEKSLK